MWSEHKALWSMLYRTHNKEITGNKYLCFKLVLQRGLVVPTISVHPCCGLTLVTSIFILLKTLSFSLLLFVERQVFVWNFGMNIKWHDVLTFAHHTDSSNWETLETRRKLSLICALFKAYSGERAWKVIVDRLQQPHYLNRVDLERKIRSRRQRTDIGKYSFVNRTIQNWNQLPAEALGTLPWKPNTLKKRVRKVIIEVSLKK